MFLRYLAYGFIICIYAAFVWVGKAPVEGFVIVLTGLLAQLGSAHQIENASKAATDAANHANPVPAPNAIILPTTVTKE